MRTKETKHDAETQPRRQWVIVPCPGSTRHDMDKTEWDRIAAQECPICHQAIDYGVGVYIYYPRRQAAHLRCTDDKEQATIDLRSNAFIIDAAARLAGLTQEAFRNLVNWKKDRLIEEMQAANANATAATPAEPKQEDKTQ